MDGTEAASAALAERARAGDPAAWREVYADAHGPLLAYAARRLGDVEAARDAVSETMARALADPSAYAPEKGSPRAWLFGICSNVVMNQQRRRPIAALPDDEVLVDLSAGPGDALEAAERAAEVRAAFSRLSPEDQELLLLRVVGQLSADDVGAALGRRPGAVRMAQSRALGRLRAHLEAITGVAGADA